MTVDETIAFLKGKKYEEGISLITCTGDRSLCMGRCFYYIINQVTPSKYNFQWVIADDSKEPYLKPAWKGVELYQRQYIANKIKSFQGNLREALLEVKYNKILIIEDDDWYSPDYIQLYSQRLEKYDLVGEAPAKYYNIKERCYKVWGGDNRASLCCTGFTSRIIANVYLCTLQHNPFVDYRLWQKPIPKRFIFKDKCHCIGIKGMPGRPGIGSGHRPANRGYIKDKDMMVLEKWIGKEDTNFYRNIYST